MKSPSRRLVPTLLAAALLAACAGSESGGPPRVGEAMPTYRAATLQGDTVDLRSLHGTPFLLNMWATWCTPCREETPFLESVYRKRSGQGLRILGVSMDTGDALAQIRDFVKTYGVTYTILRDPGMKALDQFQIPGLPATFLVDRDGILRWMRVGPVNAEDRDFQAALNDVLQ